MVAMTEDIYIYRYMYICIYMYTFFSEKFKELGFKNPGEMVWAKQYIYIYI